MENIKIEKFEDLNLVQQNNIQMYECQKQEKFTDLILKTSDGYTTEVHKNVLWSASPYFRNILDNLKTDTTSNPKKDIIELEKNMMLSDLDVLLRYMYTGIVFIPVENAVTIFEIAHLFELNVLKDICALFVVKDINNENCLHFWRYGDLYTNDTIKRKSFRKFMKNPDLIKHYLTDLQLKEFGTLISSRHLKLCADKRLDHIIEWMKEDVKPRERYAIIFLKYVNLFDISKEYFDNRITSGDVLFCAKKFPIELLTRYTQTLRIQVKLAIGPVNVNIDSYEIVEQFTCAKNFLDMLIANSTIYAYMKNEDQSDENMDEDDEGDDEEDDDILTKIALAEMASAEDNHEDSALMDESADLADLLQDVKL